MEKKNFNKGITLVSLVITIVIMLILAAVTINLVIGDNGLFNKSKMSVSQYSKAEVKEKIELALTSLEVENADSDLTNEKIVEGLPTLVDNLSIESDLTGECEGYTYHITDQKEVIIDGIATGIVCEIQKEGTLGDNNWYKSDVNCTISATYKKAGVQKVLYSLDNGANFVEGTEFTINTEGITNVQYKAIGNDGVESKVYENEVKIDKIAPEIIATQDSTDKTKINVKVTDTNETVVTNPDGSKSNSKEYQFTIAESDSFVFTVKDLAGNTKQVTCNVTNIPVVISDLAEDALKDSAANAVLKNENGNFYILGYDSFNQLGDGGASTNKTISPKKIKLPNDENGNVIKPVKVVINNTSLFVIGSDGDLYAKGQNTYGEVGNGSSGNSAIVKDFVKIYLDENDHSVKVKEVSGNYTHTLAIGTDDNLYAWGKNDYGSLGLGKDTNHVIYAKPTKVNLQGKKPKKIVTPYMTSMVLCTDNTLLAVGRAENGLLGNGQVANDAFEFTQMTTFPSGVTPVDIKATSYTFFALGNDGNLYGVGDCSKCPFGTDMTPDSTYPYKYAMHTFKKVALPDGVTIKKYACGAAHILAIGTDNKLYGWGYNSKGELATALADKSVIHEIKLPNDLTAEEIIAGSSFTIVKASDGSFYSCGMNTFYCLGRYLSGSNDYDINLVKTNFSK